MCFKDAGVEKNAGVETVSAFEIIAAHCPVSRQGNAALRYA
ncbi:hypothetical protein METH_07560 [Leisingera methylohalidivorans DSM 14336]|uniref:Uncharacterized protein n=1 Tax=Leisingera methylohalidivorans DSM 14336 TaxID=999552 RepID=V9W1C8_9RHOB|nr:hypothetical protein METH_07560 [Leisingera methylohalidivorans DSM 14336]